MNLPEVSETGLRYNAGKPDWSLVNLRYLEPMVAALMFGAQKYGRHNWKKGMPISTIYASTQRHLNAFMDDGEDADAESGVHHLGHVASNILLMLWMLQNKPEFDDRIK